jgi:ribosomal protein S18 acetylase RimI-like enzyme
LDASIGALESNFWSVWRQFGRAPGCALHEADGAVWFETPITVPPYNMVVRFTGGGGVTIDAILNRFRARKVPPLWVVHPTSPTDLTQCLAERGLVEVEEVTGMVANLADLPAAPPVPAGVEIHAVTPSQDFEPFLEYVAARWEVPLAERPTLAAIVRSFRVGGEHSLTRAWLFVKDGKVLAKAGTHDTDDVVGLYGVATKPEARGLGLARLVCLTALQAARERGQRVGVLHSTPMAVSLYRAMGFREVAPFRLYALPNSFHA